MLAFVERNMPTQTPGVESEVAHIAEQSLAAVAVAEQIALLAFVGVAEQLALIVFVGVVA